MATEDQLGVKNLAPLRAYQKKMRAVTFLLKNAVNRFERRIDIEMTDWAVRPTTNGMNTLPHRFQGVVVQITPYQVG